MERSRSIRSCSRARTSERGFALAVALIVAVLYFGMIELMLIDASRQLAEARRYRARVMAFTLAENGAELAAQNMIAGPSTPVSETDWQGSMTGEMKKPAPEKFIINATGLATGVVEQKATVEVYGSIDVDAKKITIDYTYHSQ
ncbi:MAG TPA: hypothetical protein VEK79_21315 [Thermoanaerobaculia bacterium]|nr:hypothetical protein [Thermoanaerobaculia bacterium]